MPRKMIISSPINYQTSYPETQLLEHTLALAQEIKDKKITNIQQNKAEIALKMIDDAIKKIVTWYNAQADLFNKMSDTGLPLNAYEIAKADNLRNITDELLKSYIGPGTVLGEWFNQDRNAGPLYQEILSELKIDAPAPRQETGISQIMPRRMAKAYNASQSTQNITQDFRKRASRDSTGTADTSESDSSYSSKSNRSSFK